MKAHLFALAAWAAAAPMASAQVAPPPAYFVDAVMETSTAQVIAQNCPILSLDLAAMNARASAAFARLTEDGFTAANLSERMSDPSGAIAERQGKFMARHGLRDGAPQADVCAAGLAEIAEATPIGTLLAEIEE